MVVLLLVGFGAGVVTAISPCVLPVLPILLAGGATGQGGRRPLAIVAGIVASFTAFTLAAAALLDALGLPQDTLRDIAIALLLVLAATLAFPRLGALVERPFARLTRRGAHPASGFLLGVSLGLVFVPCAGPVLATVSVLAATRHVGVQLVLLTLAYALGAAVPMLAVLLGGRRLAVALRARAVALRLGAAALMALGAGAIAFDTEQPLQTRLGSYTNRLQGWIEGNGSARAALADLRHSRSSLHATRGLDDFGPSPGFPGISRWLNTPGDRPLTMAALRGKVVLVDFWTYSCINCLRTLPHLRAWDARYRKAGLVIVGVHTPEFAFEHVASNVQSATRRLGVRYPVALDNDYATWNAYANQYWPAEYLLDRRGHVRHVHFGEGDYGGSETAIRRLLAERAVALPTAARVADATPIGALTPESYLGYERLLRYAGSPVVRDREASYRLPSRLGADQLAYAGRWRVGAERIVAGRGARLRLSFRARDVYLVLDGRGRVDMRLDGRRAGTVPVAGARLYTLVRGRAPKRALLELRFTPGVAAYAFTFG